MNNTIQNQISQLILEIITEWPECSFEYVVTDSKGAIVKKFRDWNSYSAINIDKEQIGAMLRATVGVAPTHSLYLKRQGVSMYQNISEFKALKIAQNKSSYDI